MHMHCINRTILFVWIMCNYWLIFHTCLYGNCGSSLASDMDPTACTEIVSCLDQIGNKIVRVSNSLLFSWSSREKYPEGGRADFFFSLSLPQPRILERSPNRLSFYPFFIPNYTSKKLRVNNHFLRKLVENKI